MFFGKEWTKTRSPTCFLRSQWKNWRTLLSRCRRLARAPPKSKLSKPTSTASHPAAGKAFRRAKHPLFRSKTCSNHKLQAGPAWMPIKKMVNQAIHSNKCTPSNSTKPLRNLWIRKLTSMYPWKHRRQFPPRPDRNKKLKSSLFRWQRKFYTQKSIGFKKK